ncbi:MAG TPA: DUF5668 domain-containing protein [Candidatus Limnocylindrales bacterium]|nr:DUF5668 domain-containing protein [Candidatus Limnocylindrales bacterium]
MEQRTPGRFVGPQALGLLLVIIGALFLLRNTGWFILDWDVVWPILLIVFGGWFILAAMRHRGSSGGSTYAVSVAGEERLDLDLRVGAGRFRIGAVDDPTNLVSVVSTAGDINGDVRRDGTRAHVRLVRDASWWPLGWWDGGTEWRIGLPRAVSARLDLAGGAGDFDVDLSAVPVSTVRIAVGAAQARLRLPRPTGDVPVDITTGASALIIEVPSGVEARVTTTGLLSVNGRTETAGYRTSTDRVTVTVEGGAASVKIVDAP